MSAVRVNGLDVQEDPEEDRDQAHAKRFERYFCNEVAASTRDPALLMRLMRHQSLQTTTKYLRTVSERIADAVKNLGASSGGGFDSKQVQISAQNDLPEVVSDDLNDGLTGGNTSGIFESIGSAENRMDVPHGQTIVLVVSNRRVDGEKIAVLQIVPVANHRLVRADSFLAPMKAEGGCDRLDGKARCRKIHSRLDR
jgi:hypothetical protein